MYEKPPPKYGGFLRFAKYDSRRKVRTYAPKASAMQLRPTPIMKMWHWHHLTIENAVQLVHFVRR
jgi:hypothetical protein